MGEGMKMVHLRTVPDAWQAKVLAARLGAEGIVTHLQGTIAGPYPFGAVSVHVEASQAEVAAELLLADEVEAAFAQHGARYDLFGGTYEEAPPYAWQAAAGPARDDDVRVYVTPDDDLDLRPFDQAGDWCDDVLPADGPRHHPVSFKRRAVAAFVALVVAGAPLLAHFVGQ